jgi:tRNA (guanine-N7-)-methyltransferase
LDVSEGNERQQGAPLRSFGRRRGRKLSPRQRQLLETLLPRLRVPLDGPRPAAGSDLFGAGIRGVWLEIGFGGAEHLLWQARAHPDVGLIGAEPFEEGMVKALASIDSLGFRNVRLHPDDARPLLAWLPAETIDRAFVLFPDPWPKKRHAKRRLVAPALLADLARAMRPGGELRLATDIASYAGEMLLAVRREGSFVWQARTPGDWRERPADWPETRYEQKARREGRSPYYFSLRRL